RPRCLITRAVRGRGTRLPVEPEAAMRENSEGTGPLLCVTSRATEAPADAGQLLPLVYQSLKELARRRMALERPGHTLQATALVHEAYLRLSGAKNVRWAGRIQFYHAAA